MWVGWGRGRDRRDDKGGGGGQGCVFGARQGVGRDRVGTDTGDMGHIKTWLTYPTPTLACVCYLAAGAQVAAAERADADGAADEGTRRVPRRRPAQVTVTGLCLTDLCCPALRYKPSQAGCPALPYPAALSHLPGVARRTPLSCQHPPPSNTSKPLPLTPLAVSTALPPCRAVTVLNRSLQQLKHHFASSTLAAPR